MFVQAAKPATRFREGKCIHCSTSSPVREWTINSTKKQLQNCCETVHCHFKLPSHDERVCVSMCVYSMDDILTNLSIDSVYYHTHPRSLRWSPLFVSVCVCLCATSVLGFHGLYRHLKKAASKVVNTTTAHSTPYYSASIAPTSSSYVCLANSLNKKTLTTKHFEMVRTRMRGAWGAVSNTSTILWLSEFQTIDPDSFMHA